MMLEYLIQMKRESLCISIGSASPPMKQKQVMAEAYLSISEVSISSVMGSPASSHSHGL